MSARIVLVAMFILAFASATTAQTQPTRPAIKPAESKTPADEQENTRLPDDMRIKMAIARAEEDQSEHVRCYSDMWLNSKRNHQRNSD